MSSKLPKILVVCGPTASGKSSLALALAQKFNGEIVIADSRQIYKEMLIGTNSPTQEECQQVPHHLNNFLDITEKYNVATYKQQAEKVIDDILSRGKLPIVVGGTGLYIKAIVDNYDFAATKPNAELRKKLESQTLEELLKQLNEYDEVPLAKTDRKNKRRVIRALEILLSEAGQKQKSEPHYNALQLAPKIEREELYQKINARVLEMMHTGLEKEVQTLVQKYSWETEALSGIGYREFKPFFEGTASQENIVSEIQKDTRRYAKRQLTWFKADPRIHWVTDTSEALQIAKDFLN